MILCPHCGFQNANGREICKSCRKDLAGASPQEIQQAYAVYQAALTTLKADPTNATLKQGALLQGRAYSALTRTRQGTGITVYDEMALMNDINAASAAASASVPTSTASPEERLQRLTNLFTKGIITEQEYQEQRRAILEQI